MQHFGMQPSFRLGTPCCLYEAWPRVAGAVHSLSCGAQVAQPLATLAGLHLEVITDLAWSLDGRVLAISSYDSYCRYFWERIYWPRVYQNARTLHSASQSFVTPANVACSLACFEDGELGRPLQPASLPGHIRDCLWSSVASAAPGQQTPARIAKRVSRCLRILLAVHNAAPELRK